MYVEIEISMYGCAYILWNVELWIPHPQNVHSLMQQTCGCVTYRQKDFAGVIVKCFKMERSSWVVWVGRRGYTGRPEGQQRWRWTTETEARQTERFEDAVLQALKMVEGPQAKTCRRLLGAGKGREMDPLLAPPEGTQPKDF